MHDCHFQPADGFFADRIRDSFSKMTVMESLGGTLGKVRPGEVEIYVPYRKEFTQQHGFLHAGIISTFLDTACGYAAFSLMPADAAVLSIEFKVNLLHPGKGDRFVFVGSVVKSGKNISNVRGEAYAFIGGGREKMIATMDATMMTVLGRGLAG
jgi:uncharacterized protein (TIGR00369 family)